MAMDLKTVSCPSALIVLTPCDDDSPDVSLTTSADDMRWKLAVVEMYYGVLQRTGRANETRTLWLTRQKALIETVSLRAMLAFLEQDHLTFTTRLLPSPVPKRVLGRPRCMQYAEAAD
jgi:hypothetical protein